MASRHSSISTMVTDDEESAAESELSTSTDLSAKPRRKRRRRSPRQTTRYVLAHPAPQRRTKQRMLVQFRPRLLLQLQKLEGNRPTPTFDVLPSSTVAGSLLIPMLAKKFPRIFRVKPELGDYDLLIVRSEDYNSHSGTTKGAHGDADDRDLMAVVSPQPDHGDNDADIVMSDGSIWTTSQLPNGSYEFTKVDAQGATTIARWVRKPLPPSRSVVESTDFSRPSSPQPTDSRWTFSIIDPSTRRHPIMGILTPQELDIYDTYSTMSASSGRFPPTRPISSVLASPAGMDGTAPKSEERLTEFVPQHYKQLMMVTASWVSLRMEGWPANAGPKIRRAYTNYRSTSGASCHERRQSIPCSGPSSPLTEQEKSPWEGSQHEAPGSNAVPTEAGGPQRTRSTGAAFMRKRRPLSETLVGYFDETKTLPVEVQAKDTSLSKDVEEKKHNCRVHMRRLTQKLFRRKSCHAH